MPSDYVFQCSKIRTRKQSAKKRIKTGKKMESTSFWNPESTVLRSKTQGKHNYWKTTGVKYFLDKSKTIYDRFLNQ